MHESQTAHGYEMLVSNLEFAYWYSKYLDSSRVPGIYQNENEAKREVVDYEEAVRCEGFARVCKTIQNLELCIMLVQIVY